MIKNIVDIHIGNQSRSEVMDILFTFMNKTSGMNFHNASFTFESIGYRQGIIKHRVNYSKVEAFDMYQAAGKIIDDLVNYIREKRSDEMIWFKFPENDKHFDIEELVNKS